MTIIPVPSRDTRRLLMVIELYYFNVVYWREDLDLDLDNKNKRLPMRLPTSPPRNLPR